MACSEIIGELERCCGNTVGNCIKPLAIVGRLDARELSCCFVICAEKVAEEVQKAL